MINPKKELFVWGPIEGAWHYPSYWALCYVDQFPRTYGVRWPEALFAFDHHKMTYTCEYEALRKAGWRVMEKWVLTEVKYQLVRRRFDRVVKKLDQLNKTVIRGRRSTELYRQWKEIYFEFWSHGTVPELANWGGEKFLMDALKARGITGQEYLHALEVLSAPSGIGFFQEAERDLLKIAVKAELFSRQSSALKRLLKEHTQKYFWLHNSYFGTKVLTVRDFERMLKEEIKKGSSAKRIYDIDQGPVQRAKAKEQLIRKLKLTPLEARVARVLGDTVSWQDERKKYIWQADHIVDFFLHEAARRAGVPFTMCKDLLPEEVEQIFFGKKLNVRRFSRDRRVSAGYLKRDRLSLVVGRKAKALAVLFRRKEAGKSREVSGLVVSKGATVRGRVRLIFSPAQEAKRMKQGDILVTGMTSPDYIVVMKRAGAIVTDEGGMTSHAAVVYRELGIPCIVGTKVATQIFKDGDRVEVDADKGIVRKI